MERKNLVKTYNKKVSVEQVIQEQTQEAPPRLVTPASAGGHPSTGAPITLSQEYLQFVDGIDEVPIHIRGKVWAVVSRMNNLTFIDGVPDYERIMHGVQAILDTMQMDEEISLQDAQEILLFVSNQLRRSRMGRERKWIAPGYQDITHAESSSNTSVIEDRPANNAAAGFLNKGKAQGGRFGGR